MAGKKKSSPKLVLESAASQDAVRFAFNSPFRPFMLASMSIGQEGLDFHPRRHRLIHWNLPGNPVDLEQREGRVHRYKGHAVRRNVAEFHAETALVEWSRGTCLWTHMFELAEAQARSVGASDLVPHWIAPGACNVQRRVPMLPYTSEVEAFKRLKRQLAAYRVVFGQPRQEELITLLDRADIDPAALSEWAIDLRPPGEGAESIENGADVCSFLPGLFVGSIALTARCGSERRQTTAPAEASSFRPEANADRRSTTPSAEASRL